MKYYKVVLKKNSISSLILFLLGIMCQLSPLWSRISVALFIIGLIYLYILDYKKNNRKIMLNKGMMWYTAFFALVLISYSYTTNVVDPNYVTVRMLACFCVQAMMTLVVKFDENFTDFLKGISVGGLIGIIIVLFNQYSYIGVKRLGGGIFGSYAEFGNVCMHALVANIWLMLLNRKDKKMYLLTVISIIGVFVSGARKAMLTPILFFLHLKR